MSSTKLVLTFVFAMLAVLEASKTKAVTKRGLPLYPPLYPDDIPSLTSGIPKWSPISIAPWGASPKSYPSAAEVANAIAVAKQASANVLIAQQQVQAAKENVLNQQRVAMEKETNAAILTQKSEAAAAIQRSEAASAAQAVILAQQRLATAKAAVAHEQRIAATKEAQAAAALQSSAYAAAAEIQKTEHEASKTAALQRSGTAAAAHHVAATKDAALAPITSGNNHVPNLALAWHQPLNAIVANPWISTSGSPTAHAALYPTSKAIWG